MRSEIVVFFQGISSAAAAIAALVFLKFWRDSDDRLFAYFSAAFALMSLSWALLGLFSPTEETRPYIYAIRLAAFLLIIVAIVDKNRDA